MPDIEEIRRVTKFISELPTLALTESYFDCDNAYRAPVFKVTHPDGSEFIYEEAHEIPEGQYHQQGVWVENSCGTAACLAGWDAILNGVPFDLKGYLTDPDDIEFVKARLGAEAEENPNGVHISLWSRAHFGLTFGQAFDLFCGSNSLSKIETITDQIEAEAK